MNEYTPWVEKGMTELEYFKYRYLEMYTENDRLQKQNNIIKKALEIYENPYKYKEIIDDVTSIPDFYSETDFGLFARDALKEVEEIK